MLRSLLVDTRRSTRRLMMTLVGESLREVAVLIAVFLPLDLFARGKLLTARFLISTIVTVSILFGLGVFLEVKSRWTR
jgi:hypothetical protein